MWRGGDWAEGERGTPVEVGKMFSRSVSSPPGGVALCLSLLLTPDG